jgi:hypothetical protein
VGAYSLAEDADDGSNRTPLGESESLASRRDSESRGESLRWLHHGSSCHPPRATRQVLERASGSCAQRRGEHPFRCFLWRETSCSSSSSPARLGDSKEGRGSKKSRGQDQREGRGVRDRARRGPTRTSPKGHFWPPRRSDAVAQEQAQSPQTRPRSVWLSRCLSWMLSQRLRWPRNRQRSGGEGCPSRRVDSLCDARSAGSGATATAESILCCGASSGGRVARELGAVQPGQAHPSHPDGQARAGARGVRWQLPSSLGWRIAWLPRRGCRATA